jgi:hypothetical protein
VKLYLLYYKEMATFFDSLFLLQMQVVGARNHECECYTNQLENHELTVLISC